MSRKVEVDFSVFCLPKEEISSSHKKPKDGHFPAKKDAQIHTVSFNRNHVLHNLFVINSNAPGVFIPSHASSPLLVPQAFSKTSFR